MRIEYTLLGDLRRWPANPKLHDEAGIDASIKRFGFCDPIAVSTVTGEIVEGHGRLTALEAMHRSGGSPPASRELR